MNKINLIYFLLLLSVFSSGQTCQWAKSCDGFSESHSICADKNGNVFITGFFAAPSLVLGPYTLTCPSNGAVFIAKYDPSGNVVWAKSAPCDGGIWGYAVSADKDGAVYTTGYFSGTSIIFDTYTLTNTGGGELYIVKYDPNGNVAWAKKEGGVDGIESGHAVKTDPSGNVFTMGYSTSTLMTVGSYTLTNPSAVPNEVGMYIIKYDSAGNVQWAKSANGLAYGYSGTTDTEGNAYVSGAFGNSTMSIGSFTLTQTDPNYAFFLVKFDGSGNVLWAKTEKCGFGYSLSTNQGNDLFITGAASGSLSGLGSYTFSNNDVFLAKYDKDGNVMWAKGFGSGSNYGHSVTSDASNVYVTGRFSNPLIFGTYTLSVPPGFVNPIYFARFDFNGNFISATALNVGNTFPNHQNWIAADAFSNVYLTGFFQTNPFNTGCGALAPTGNRSGFLAKYHFDDVGVTENFEENAFQLFPNPANDLLFLNFDTKEFSKAEIINSLGQLVKTIDLTHSIEKTEISVKNLKEGIYILNLPGGNAKTVSKRFIISR